MPSTSSKRTSSGKSVICTHCGQETEVAKRAMSIFCPHCRKRLILEDFTIKSYYAVRDFATCGNIVVNRGGHVVAPIKVGKLTIRGKVQGNVAARGQVKVSKHGRLHGDVKAPALIVEKGAELLGFLEIKPQSD